MNCYKLLFFLALGLASGMPLAVAQTDHNCYIADPAAGARERNFDVQHILIDISLNPTEGKVSGTVEHTFVPLQKDVDTIFMDAPRITIKKVLLDKQEVKFTTDDKGVTIRFGKTLHWDERHMLNISYEATPRKGLYFVGWNDTTNMSRKQIWSQGQGIDNRRWIPMFDDMNDKAISEIKLSFDKNYRVLSNGELIESKENKDGTKFWHYRITHPHSPYLIMLAIGKYDVKTSKSKSGVIINNWYYPEFPETVEPTYRYTDAMMDFLEGEFGTAYPWHAYSQVPVQDFMYGAMENTTATVFGDFYVLDKRAYLDRSYVGTNAHEMVHQWWGDFVSARSSEHAWLQESFATHYAKTFERSAFGEDHFQWTRRGEFTTVLDAGKNNSFPIVHTQAGSQRIYSKGSLVLDMLKYVLGEEQYKRAIVHFLKNHPYGNVDTHEFYISFWETSGINLDWFFDQWLYKGGEPRYKVSYLPVSGASPFTQVTVKQVHQQDGITGLFRMPIVFEVYYKDGSSSTVKEWIEAETQTVNVPNPGGKEIDYVLFDPNSQVLKAVEFTKGVEELKSQALKAKNMIDRYDALKALDAQPYAQKKTMLTEAYGKEPFWANRVEIVEQLADGLNELDATLVKQILKDPHARVRQALLDNSGQIPQKYLADFEVLLTDSSYWTVENALIKLSAQYPKNIPQYLETTKNDRGVGNKVRVAWLEIAVGYDRNRYLPQLVEYASPSYEFRTRGYAFAALAKLNYLDEKLLSYLTNGALSPNNRLANPANNALTYYKGQTEYKKMIRDYYRNNKWKDWQEEILKTALW